MTRIPSWLMVIIAVVLAVLGGRAISAQDKYTVQVPNGLAFSEFRGYEDWQTVAVSQTEDALAAILANPVMIDAYRAGVPGNGKPFPDGSKIAKIHWKPKKSTEAPAPTTKCRAPCKTLTSSRRIASGSRTAADGDTPRLTMTPRPTRSRPPPWLTSRRRGTTPSAGSRATRS